MAWYTVEEYAKLTGITIQGVYKRIKTERVKTMKGEGAQILVWKDTKNPEPPIIISDNTTFTENQVNTQIETIKDFFESLVNEIKLSKENELNSMKREIETIKQHQERIEKMKDSTIDEQKKEIQWLREEIEKIKSKGFLKKLFG